MRKLLSEIPWYLPARTSSGAFAHYDDAVNIRRPFGDTKLHWACLMGALEVQPPQQTVYSTVLPSSPSISPKSVGDVDAVRALLRQGAYPDAANNIGATPLMEAAARGYIPTAQLLLRSFAFPCVCL